MSRIIAHIVGLPMSLKEIFYKDIKKFKNNDLIKVVDIDELSINIMRSKKVMEYYEEIEKLNINMMEKKGNKKIVQDKKRIEKLINEYWKNKIVEDIEKEKNIATVQNKNIIIIGYSTFSTNYKNNIKIDTSNKLFIKLNLIDNAKKIIETYLDNNRNDIINGIFDLNYLNLNFLIKKREDLQFTYQDFGYKVKSYQNICNILQLFMQTTKKEIKIADGLFFIDELKMNKNELKKKKNITAYTKEWLALISNINDDDKSIIKYGYKNNNPYIDELNYNTLLKMLNKEVNLYYTTDVDAFMPEINIKNMNVGGIYKFISTKPIKNFTTIKIDNIYDRLISKKVKINLLKSQNK